jgi:hypothetical protein
MWRKRWFVLKQGYLFRFLTPDVSGGCLLGLVGVGWVCTAGGGGQQGCLVRFQVRGALGEFLAGCAQGEIRLWAWWCGVWGLIRGHVWRHTDLS